ncbi:MAG: hypothetical protein LUM44_22980 [Pyrinomonadaceae bacterium]|nr:hypothetical protein [Pyrinomonadaceae bacterium]
MSEVGHAKNVANFETLINIIIALGLRYQPSNPAIFLTALQVLLNDAKAKITAVSAADAEETNAAKTRNAAFEGHLKLATRVINAYNASSSDELVSSNLAGFMRRLRGERKGEKPVDDPATPGNESSAAHSVSHLSYDNLAATWRELIELLKTQAGYKPNEEDLKIANLETYVADLEAKQTTAKNATIASQNARTDRNAVLYDEETGIIPIVKKIKKYVKSIPDSEAVMKQITALKFREVK